MGWLKEHEHNVFDHCVRQFRTGCFSIVMMNFLLHPSSPSILPVILDPLITTDHGSTVHRQPPERQQD